MRDRGALPRWLSMLTLAVGTIACAPGREAPAPASPPRDPVTEETPRQGDDPPPEKDRPVAPPPAYGHRVASADVGGPEQGRAVNPASSPSPDPAGSQTCVDTWPEVRYRNYGYDHIIHLLSRCEVRAYCAVSSDVNPETVHVEVPPREHVEVLTFRGSPAREFTARVVCRLRA